MPREKPVPRVPDRDLFINFSKGPRSIDIRLMLCLDEESQCLNKNPSTCKYSLPSARFRKSIGLERHQISLNEKSDQEINPTTTTTTTKENHKNRDSIAPP
eukprot:m.259704 g.259704  ORF g.259704 m.259704 type:complete len:101 (+) comp54586_c0_seq14:1678-1980(+)